MAINESDEVDAYYEGNSIHDEHAYEKSQQDIERRMSQLMDVEHIKDPKKKSTKSSVKRADLPGLGIVEDAEESFNLDPVKFPKKDEQFSFGKNNTRNNNSLIIADDQNTSANSKVTIPIDWDYIIDKYIKNTNTNVIEANKGAEGKDEEGNSDDDY